MSELAFDKEGEPIELHEDCEVLRVRRFRNPGMRGTCETVREDDGAPLSRRRSRAQHTGDFVEIREGARLDDLDARPGTAELVDQAPRPDELARSSVHDDVGAQFVALLAHGTADELALSS